MELYKATLSDIVNAMSDIEESLDFRPISGCLGDKILENPETIGDWMHEILNRCEEEKPDDEVLSDIDYLLYDLEDYEPWADYTRENDIAPCFGLRLDMLRF